MRQYKATLIISVYKNTRFLKAVLDSLQYQTETNFEVIISEDGDSEEMREFINAYSFHNSYQHLTQPDTGWRKNVALNRAILASNSEHLIFIDGDCVLHPRFIESHVEHFNPHRILTGLRVFLNEKESDKLLANAKHLKYLQPRIWLALIYKKGIRRPEEGLYIPYMHKLRKLNYLTGCNMSFPKSAILAINGFDEDYVKPAYGEDTDLVWRFRQAGFEFYSLRNLAIEYHLHHKPSWSDQSENMAMGKAKAARGEFFCLNGIKKLK